MTAAAEQQAGPLQSEQLCSKFAIASELARIQLICQFDVQDLSLQHLTNIMWTLATFNHVLPSVSDTFIPELVNRARQEEFNAQQLCNLLWSMAIMQVTF